jgi:hypothetical protein
MPRLILGVGGSWLPGEKFRRRRSNVEPRRRRHLRHHRRIRLQLHLHRKLIRFLKIGNIEHYFIILFIHLFFAIFFT